MWISVYFILSALESGALWVFSLMESSHPQESLLINYSTERLLLLVALFLLGLFFLLLAYHTLARASRLVSSIERALRKPIVLAVSLLISLLLCAGILFLVTQPPQAFGTRLNLYLRLKPLLLWLFVISFQTFFFALVWGGVHASQPSQDRPAGLSIKEMDFVLLVFLAALLLKLLLMIPSAYGFFKDTGESKYFNMIYYLFEGRFYAAADVGTTHYPFLYPLLLVFTYWFKNSTFFLIVAANAFFSSSIIFPLYLLARQLLERPASRLLIVLASLIPFQFLLPNRLLSENLYFPLLLWSLFLTFTLPSDRRYRTLWDCLTALFWGLLYLTRFISLAVIPALLVIWWLKPFADQANPLLFSANKIARALLMLVIAALVFSPWVAIALNNGLTCKEALGFGIAANTNPEQLTLTNLLIWALLYATYYLLLAAPMLNGVFLALHSFKLNAFFEGANRWLASLAVLLLGFTAAVVRHSWRAFYNLELPQKIMGRYVIYFVPLFLLTGFLGLETFQRSKTSAPKRSLLPVLLLPALLVGFSYVLLILGKPVPLGANFIDPLISIDGFYIQQMGSLFFVLILLLYSVTAFLIWNKKKETLKLISLILLAFYLVALPACWTLLDQQTTFQRLGYSVSERMLAVESASAEPAEYAIYLSRAFSSDQRKDFSWSLYVRNLDCAWQVKYFPPEEPPSLADLQGGTRSWVIYPPGGATPSGARSTFSYEIHGHRLIVAQYF